MIALLNLSLVSFFSRRLSLDDHASLPSLTVFQVAAWADNRDIQLKGLRRLNNLSFIL